MIPRSITHRVLASLLAIGLSAAISGCESQSSTSTGPSPVKCQVTVEAPADAVAPAGGQGAVAITAAPECAWTAAPGATWLTALTPSSGQGSGRVEFRAADNPAGTMRQSYIAINDQQAVVQQQAAPCRFEVSPLAPSVDAGGGNVAITVSTLAGCRWEARATAGWISLSNSSGTGSGSVSARVNPIENESRSAAIVVAGQTVTLSQVAPPIAGGGGGTGGGAGATSCSYSVAPSSLSLGSAATSATVTVSTTAACAWTVAGGAPWITGSPAIGAGPGVVTVAVTANTGAARTSTLTIAGQSVTIAQAATVTTPPPTTPPPTTPPPTTPPPTTPPPTTPPPTTPPPTTPPPTPPPPTTPPPTPPPCTFSISPTEQWISEKGGSMSVAVSTGTGCAWTAKSHQKWIDIKAGASGSGPGTVSLEIDAGKKRTGTVTIAGQEFTVRQSKTEGGD